VARAILIPGEPASSSYQPVNIHCHSPGKDNCSHHSSQHSSQHLSQHASRFISQTSSHTCSQLPSELGTDQALPRRSSFHVRIHLPGNRNNDQCHIRVLVIVTRVYRQNDRHLHAFYLTARLVLDTSPGGRPPLSNRDRSIARQALHHSMGPTSPGRKWLHQISPPDLQRVIVSH
jgi:hypothetical protein